MMQESAVLLHAALILENCDIHVVRTCPFAAMLTFHFANDCNFPWKSLLRSGKACKSVLARSPR